MPSTVDRGKDWKVLMKIKIKHIGIFVDNKCLHTLKQRAKHISKRETSYFLRVLVNLSIRLIKIIQRMRNKKSKNLLKWFGIFLLNFLSRPNILKSSLLKNTSRKWLRKFHFRKNPFPAIKFGKKICSFVSSDNEVNEAMQDFCSYWIERKKFLYFPSM